MAVATAVLPVGGWRCTPLQEFGPPSPGWRGHRPLRPNGRTRGDGRKGPSPQRRWETRRPGVPL